MTAITIEREWVVCDKKLPSGHWKSPKTQMNQYRDFKNKRTQVCKNKKFIIRRTNITHQIGDTQMLFRIVGFSFLIGLHGMKADFVNKHPNQNVKHLNTP